jgi:hypothetical protein
VYVLLMQRDRLLTRAAQSVPEWEGEG